MEKYDDIEMMDMKLTSLVREDQIFKRNKKISQICSKK